MSATAQITHDGPVRPPPRGVDPTTRDAQDLLYTQMFDTRERGAKWTAFAVAVLLHAGVLAINFPEFRPEVEVAKKSNVLIVKKYVPPPPKIERKQLVKKKITRKVAIPDPTPEEPEPIREPEPVYEETPVPLDVELIIGEPEAPPPVNAGPLIAGVGDVTTPELILDTKVRPEYPELARIARLEATLILQAVIHSDGSVGDLRVLRSNRPHMGFEDAAIDAVKQWRYEPATQNGRPVDVYFTVVVEFVLKQASA